MSVAEEPGYAPWWQCLRRGPVSGRYEGRDATTRLVLRVDIDPRSIDSPVLDRLSGELWTTTTVQQPGRPPRTFDAYRESWIVDEPTVTWARCSVTVTGRVRWWRGTHPTTDLRVTVPWGTFTPAGPATVELRPSGATPSSYVCQRVSDAFRDLELEVDVCTSVDAEPVLPEYDTHGHLNRPPSLRRRELSIVSAYAEAGVKVTLRPERTVIDDSAPAFATWSVAELHDAMETHYGRFGDGWPNWRMWGLQAGTFTSAGTGGIMFDARAAYGGAGEAPDRQGFAVFRDHPWFDALVPDPSTQAQWNATRQSLYTWVHEAGHAFNLLHSWDKSRPDALSWMNYAWRYDDRNGEDTFWGRFDVRFDDEELIHLRHGDRAAVIMGGDEWASGGHLRAADAMAGPDGPLELMVRTRGYYAALEPVSVELRLRNLLDVPLTVDGRLAPDHGNVYLELRRPDGMVVPYSPISCHLAEPEPRTLAPTGVEDGTDRHSQLVLIAYGSGGHLFTAPGEYGVRATYHGPGGIFAVSNAARLRVGAAYDEATDRLCHDVSSDQAGLALMLGGSRSRHVEDGMAALESVCVRGGMAGAAVGAVVTEGLVQPFFELALDADGDHGQLVQRAAPEPDRALAITETGLEVLREHGTKSDNLLYRELVEVRAGAHVETGDPAAAHGELVAMRDDLKARGARPAVLASIAATAASIDGAGVSSRRPAARSRKRAGAAPGGRRPGTKRRA